MLEITPAPSSDQFPRIQSALYKFLPESRLKPCSRNTGIRHRRGARTSGFRRMVKDLISKATNIAKSQSTNSKFKLVLVELSEEAARPTTASPTPEAVAKNENLTGDAVLYIIWKSYLASISNPSATNPLAMNSETGVSRGGNYETTSQSFIDTYLARRKREEIDRLMGMLMEWMDSPRSTRGTTGPTGSSSSRASPSSRASSTSNQSLSGQKRTHGRDSLDGSNLGGDGNEEDRQGNKRPRVASADTPKLACPFFKRDTQKYSNRQACTGPGYSSIARLKEHIYRCHRQPENKCLRCSVAFPSGEKLEEHQRADEPCMVSKDKTIDGITDAQYHQLRKKPIGTKSNAERWEEVYRIIFPKASCIPSPYYDYDDRKGAPQCGEQDLECIEYFQNELLQGVRNDLEDRFEKFTTEIRYEFCDILRERFELIHQRFQKLAQARRPKVPSSHSPPIQAAETSHLNQDTSLENFDIFNFLEQPYFDPTLAEPLNPEWLTEDAGDSAYYSAGSPKSS